MSVPQVGVSGVFEFFDHTVSHLLAGFGVHGGVCQSPGDDDYFPGYAGVGGEGSDAAKVFFVAGGEDKQ